MKAFHNLKLQNLESTLSNKKFEECVGNYYKIKNTYQKSFQT